MGIAKLLAAAFLTGCAATAAPRSDDLFARVESGMSQQQVRALLGAPDNVMPFPLSRTTSWGYFYFDPWGYYVEFSVTFAPDGSVLSKLSRRLNDGGDLGT